MDFLEILPPSERPHFDILHVIAIPEENFKFASKSETCQIGKIKNCLQIGDQPNRQIQKLPPNWRPAKSA